MHYFGRDNVEGNLDFFSKLFTCSDVTLYILILKATKHASGSSDRAS